MAEKKTIELEVKDNLQPTIQNLRELKKQLKETAAGSKDFDKISAQIRDMDDAISDAKATNDDFLGQLENASGPLGMLGKSIRGAERTFSSFNGALKASVIGLIVSLIGGLVAAFQDNEVAMKKLQPLLDGMQKVFQGIFRAVEPLFNTLVDLAISALPTVSKAFGVVYSSVTAVFQSLGMLGSAIKKLISGDFSGAWQDAKSSVTDFSKNYDASIKRFNDGTKEMSKTEKEEAEKRAEARKAADAKRKEQQEKAKQDAIAIAKEEAEALKAFQDDVLKNQQQMNVDKANSDIQDALDEKERKRQSLEDISAMVDGLETENSNNAKIASDKKTQDEIDAEKRKNDAIATSKQNLNNIIAGLEASGLAKTKAGQVISKAIALTQIGIDSAVAISKASTLANAEGVAAQLAFPTVPGVGTIARVVSYASTAASVIGNIARARQLLSSGSAGGGSAPSGGGGATGGAAPAAPAFNVVGASPTNQLAQTIGNQQQQPIKAYVVSNDVTTAQGLERNIISSASIG